MTEHTPMNPDDLADIAATDALFDRFAANEAVPAPREDGQVLELLSTWRTELDERMASSMTTEMPAVPNQPHRWVRAHRRAAAVTAIAVAIAGTTGVAAATPKGPFAPLHRLITGDKPASHFDARAAEARDLLDKVAVAVRGAQATAPISTALRDRLAADLDKVQQLLDGDPLAPNGLRDRLNRLRGTLAGIPVADDKTPPAVLDDHGGHGSDDADTDDHGGGSGSDEGSDDGSGDDHGSRSGSDDGNGGGGSDDRSGSDDGTGSGSDDGSGGGVSGGGSDDSTTSGSGGGSDDSTSGSGGGSDDGSGGGDSGGGSDDSTSGSSGGSDDGFGVSDSSGGSDDSTSGSSGGADSD